jgi:hypothetical protein
MQSGFLGFTSGSPAPQFTPMKLQRLAGYGPTAAFVSAVSLFVFFVILIFGTPIVENARGIAVPMTILYFLTFWVWLGGLGVVVFDLEWLEHPATSTTWFQVAHWATLVALVVPVVLGISLLAGAGVLVQASFFATFVLVGLSLLTHNIDARRAGLLKGALPWLGIVTGAAYVVAGFGIWTIPPIGFAGLILGQTFYIAWAVWMGARLSGTRTAAAQSLAAP